jgi:hypothetical protein
MRQSLTIFAIASFILGLFVFVSTARCQDSYTLYKIPAGHRVTVASGEMLQGYTLTEYKKLLLVDAQLKACDASLIQVNREAVQLKVASDNLNTAVLLKEQEKGLLTADLLRKNKELSETVSDNLKLQRKLTLRKRLLRIGGGVIGAVVGGLVLGLVAGHR